MEWRDEGLIIGARRHGESSLILDVMTREHGRQRGLVRGGRGRRSAPTLQPGNEVAVTWRARLEEQLGVFTLEATRLRAADLMATPTALHGLNLLTALLRLLAEREPHALLHDAALALLDLLDPAADRALEAAAAVVRFELAVLAESGFGLDLTACAATGLVDDLAYVSPRSSRAVSRQAGSPFRDRLLPLPGFLLPRAPDTASAVEPAEIEAGFALTGFFLARDVFAPRGLPVPRARDAFLEQLRLAPFEPVADRLGASGHGTHS